jgi:uncharacterized membrane protein
VLAHSGIAFDHVPSKVCVGADTLGGDHGAFVLSDYPAAGFAAGCLERLVELVALGRGLVMIGGWASFAGISGGYGPTCLAGALPVLMEAGDDRVNAWGPCVVTRARPHRITDGLPLDSDLPSVCGFNRVTAREGSHVALEIARFCAVAAGGGVTFDHTGSHPLLVTGSHGAGRVACFASDAAPHWVGGLVDWGATRITAGADARCAVEVGGSYARLFSRLIRWALGRL